MSRIIACYKWVADEAGISVGSDLSVDFSKTQKMISNYDRQVIEAAVQAASSLGAVAAGLTFNGESGSASLKEALSRGLDECYFVRADARVNPDGRATAKALAEEIRNIEDVKLVICGEGASDTYARQTAPRIGAILDLPVVTSVNRITIEGDEIVLVRKLSDCNETVRVRLPAVIAVLPEINQPPLPGLKAIMAAKKKPVTEISLTDILEDASSKSHVVSKKGYLMNRKNIVFTDGDAQQKVDNLYEGLRKEGVV